MAFSGFIDEGLSARDVRSKVKTTVSPKKFVYEPGTTPEALKKYGDETKRALTDAVTVPYGSAEYYEMVGNLPVFISSDHQATFLPIGSNPFTHPATSSALSSREKASVIPHAKEWKDAGWDHAMRAMRTPKGETPKAADEAPEWDYLTFFSLSRTEMAKLSEADVATLIDITVDEFRQSQLREWQDDEKTGKQVRNPTGHGKGFKEMFVFPLHTDTDNFHIQGFVNRHPWNIEEKVSGPAEYKASIFANLRENVNRRLSDAGIDLVIGSNVQAVFDTRAETSDVEAAIEVLQQEGLDVHPELTTGPITQNGKVATSKPVLGMEEYEKGLVELNKDLIENQRQKNIILERLKLTQDAIESRKQSKELNDRIEILEGEKAALAEDNATLSDQVIAVEEEKVALTEELGAAKAELADKSEELTSTKQELSTVSSELAVETEKGLRLEDQNSRLENEVSVARSSIQRLSSAFAKVWQSRRQWQRGGLEAMKLVEEQGVEMEELRTSRDEIEKRFRDVNTKLGKSLTDVKVLTAERDVAEANAKEIGEAMERLIAEKAQLVATVTPMQTTLALYEKMATGAEAEADVEPAGTGFKAFVSDIRKRRPDIQFPDAVKVSKSIFSKKVTLALPDGVTQMIAHPEWIKVTKGSFTEDALEISLLHAQREGWASVAIDIADPKMKAKAIARAKELGLIVEGQEVAATISRGDPVVETKAEAPESAPVAEQAPVAETPPAAEQPKAKATTEKGVPTWVVSGTVKTEEEQRDLAGAFQSWQTATAAKAEELRGKMETVTDEAEKREIEKQAIQLENRVSTYSMTDYLEYRHNRYVADVKASEWRTKEPKDWTPGQRKAAQSALKKAQGLKHYVGVSLDEYGAGAHAKWRKEHPEEAAKLDAEKNQAQKPTAPKPE